MMRKLIIWTFVVIVLQSCNRKKDPVGVPTPQYDYRAAIQLKTGNYWKFKSYKVFYKPTKDSIQLFEEEPIISVGHDTLISNKVFKIVTFNNNPFGLWRDSSGFILDHLGRAIFSSQIIYAAISYSVDQYPTMMISPDLPIQVPAFNNPVNTISSVDLISHGESPHTNSPPHFNKDWLIARRTWYAKNVGIVKYAYYYGHDFGINFDLIEYHLNN